MNKRNIEQLLDLHTYKQEEFKAQVDYMDENILYVERVEEIPEAIASKTHANILCFCTRGAMEITVNGKHYTVGPGDTLVCPSNVLVERPLVSPDFKFTIIALTDSIVRELLANNLDVWNRAVYVRQALYMKVKNEEERDASITTFWHLTELIKVVIHSELTLARKEAMRCIAQMFLFFYCSRQRQIDQQEAKQADEKQPMMMQGRNIFNTFMDMLRDEPKKHQPVYYYAQKLCVTPKHLSFVCKQVAGKTAQELIQNAVIEDIVAYLRDSTLTVKQIAARMGFNNLSFFGKYVRGKLGVSPNEYRRKLIHG